MYHCEQFHLFAALLVFGCCVSAIPLINPLDRVDPLNPFPAGLPTPNNAYVNNVLNPWEEPSIPESAYRGLYGHTTCQTDVLIRPESTNQLSAAMKDLQARSLREGRPLKMRATKPSFATMSSMTCAQQPTLLTPFTVDGKTPIVVGIMMDKMVNSLDVNKSKLQLKVQGQMTLKDLYALADANGMSVPRSALPWWQGLTLAGVFSTSSHGTGNNVTSMICDWFVDITWVDAQGNIHTSAKGSEEAYALCGGLGLLGTITELTLQMTPTSKTHFFTWYLKDDTNLADDIEEMLKITPHLVVMWRPDIKKYTGHMQAPAEDTAVPIPGAQCNVIPQQTDIQAAMSGPLFRMWQMDPFNKGSTYYQIGYDSSACTLAMTSAVGAPWVTKPSLGSPLGVPTPLLEGVALTNHITSTECGERCAFKSKKLMATALDVEFAFERSRLKEWIADIRQLIKQDLRGIPGWGASVRCLLPGYYVMRFGKAPESYVGNAAGLKEPVYTQQQMLASKATPGIPSRYEWVQEAYEQLTLCKYNARPHTGKNWDRTFTNPRCPLPAKYGENLRKMVAMQDKYDPARVFEPELWTRMVKGEGYALKPKCQLDRSCYCEADEHCADGFVCVPSLAFPEYKQCRPKVMN